MENVIIDTPARGADGFMWCHLAARDLETLHRFARSIGLKPQWFQGEYYDIKSARIRADAIRAGAVQVSRRYLFTYIRNS